MHLLKKFLVLTNAGFNELSISLYLLHYSFDIRIGMVFLFPENIRHYFATLWTAATIQINTQHYIKAVDNGIVINSSSGGIYSTTLVSHPSNILDGRCLTSVTGVERRTPVKKSPLLFIAHFKELQKM